MDVDWIYLLAGMGVLTLYLFISARTEMFTAWGDKKNSIDRGEE